MHLLKFFPLTCLVLSGCMTNGSQPSDQKNSVIGAYSMLAPASSDGFIVYGRLIINGVLASSEQCPKLTDTHGNVVKSTIRAFRPDETLFPVTVCESTLALDTQYQVENSEFMLSSVSKNPTKIQIFGDTGCKTKDCKSASAKPFGKLADLGANARADIILHMGDYNYRGTSGSIEGDTYAYDAGDGGYGGPSCGLEETYYSQNAVNSPKPDSWQSWQQDFFEPAKRLMQTAPFVFARGNHELCSRAGIGWFYFFGPGSQLQGGVTQQVCPDQGNFDAPPKAAKDHIAMIKPYNIGLDNINIWVFDSANACDDKDTNSLTADYTKQFNEINAFASTSSKPTWLMTHRPIWGVNGGKPITTINKQLQSALANTQLGKLDSNIRLSLSGHMHIYQSATFSADSGRPPQLVVGNSGVSLSDKTKNVSFPMLVDGQKALMNVEGKHGFLNVELSPDARQWRGEFIDKKGQVFLTCGSTNTGDRERLCK